MLCELLGYDYAGVINTAYNGKSLLIYDTTKNYVFLRLSEKKMEINILPEVSNTVFC